MTPDATSPAAGRASGAAGLKGWLKRVVPAWLVRYRFPTRKRRLALTFDDGPLDGLTDRALDALRAAGQRATFFVIGRRAERSPGLLRAMRARGCEVGNHSYSHPDLSRCPRRRLAEEIDRTDAVIESITGARPRFFRPPYGAVSPALWWQLRRRDRVPVLWGHEFGGFESGFDVPPDQIVADFSRAVLRPGDVILLHDVNENVSTALPAVLDLLAERGWELTTLSELAAG
jgi:peptidoglycan/xylan/chitin deacetylase (PgdA/CDA1 family)